MFPFGFLLDTSVKAGGIEFFWKASILTLIFLFLRITTQKYVLRSLFYYLVPRSFVHTEGCERVEKRVRELGLSSTNDESLTKLVKLNHVTRNEVNEFKTFNKLLKKHENLIGKCCDEFMSTICRAVLVSVGAYLFWDHECWSNQKLYHAGKRMNESEILYIYIEFIWHFHKCFILVFDHKQNDIISMGTHHAVTITMIFISLWFDMHIYTCVMFFIHDISDVFLSLSKTLHYLQWKPWDVYMFGVVGATWYISRNYWFIKHPLHAAYICVFDGGCDLRNKAKYIGVSCCFFCLLILQFLHIYWGWRIIQVVLRKLGGGELKDFRSASEAEDRASRKNR